MLTKLARGREGWLFLGLSAGARVRKPDFVYAPTVSALAPQHIINVNFDNQIELWGYDSHRPSIGPAINCA
jgi:hypothetical protein